MNNKGFTMVELLVAMAIMGLLMIMAFPTMRAVQTNNEKKKFESFGEAVISATKLYVDSYSNDLFDPSIKNEFKLIELSEIQKKGLLKDINVSNVTCVNGQSNVTVVKYNNDYSYCLNLVCTDKNNNEVYKTDNVKGSCAKFTKIDVTYKYGTHTKTYKVIDGEESYKLLSPSQVGFDSYLKNEKMVFDKWDKGNVGQEIEINGNTTINVVGHKYNYNIVYDKSINTATGTTASTPCTCGSNCIIGGNNYVLKGYTFLNWKNGSTDYKVGDNVKDSIGKSIDHDGQDVHLSTYFRKNILTLNYYSNGGHLAVGNNQRCCVQAGCKYNECTWRVVDGVKRESDGCQGKEGFVHTSSVSYGSDSLSEHGLADHKGKAAASLYMEKSGYIANDYYHVGSANSSKLIDENTRFAHSQDLANAVGRLADFEKGDLTLDLYAGWDFDSSVSKTEPIRVYYYKYKKRKCEKDVQYNKYTVVGPWREYYFYIWKCVCKLNSANMYVGSLKGNPEFISDNHIGNTMEIFYNNNNDGVKSCNNESGYFINQNVNTLCIDGYFDYGNNNVTGFHGYKWYKNNEGSGVYHKLTNGWYHNEKKFDERYTGAAPSDSNDINNVKKACKHSCNVIYPKK